MSGKIPKTGEFPSSNSAAVSSVKANVKNAFVLYQRGQLFQAEQMCRNILAVRPREFEALHLLAALRHQVGQPAEALQLIGAALRERPHEVHALTGYGVLLIELNRFDEALAVCDRTLVLHPNNAEVFNNRGNALQGLKRFEEAIASYDKAIGLRPGYAESFNNRGLALKETNRFGEALLSYDKAIALKPNYAAAVNNRAIVLTELGRLREARQAAEYAIQLAPRKAAFYFTFGNTGHYGVEDPRVAAMEKLAREAATLSSSDRIDLHFALAKAYEDLGQVESSFEQMLAGNTLKRQQISYNEAATLRMMDQTREVFTSEVFQNRERGGEPSSVPVFIIGMPRSGTTLLEQILASHPQVFGGGELSYFGDGLGILQGAKHGSRVSGDLPASVPNSEFRKLGENYLAKLQRLAPHASRIIDKLPSNFLYAGLIHLALPNAVIIRTLRDPVDTCVSCFSKLFTVGHEYSYDLAELGRYYRRYQALMEHWHQVLPPGRILDMRYEDLVDDLEHHARQAIAHCGLDWDPRCLDFHRTERPVRTASAAQVREPLYQNAVGRWRAYEQYLGPLLRELELRQ